MSQSSLETSRHILITGATRGLGRALAGVFAGQGHRVTACGRAEEPLADLRKGYPAPNRFDRVDISSWREVEAWANEVLVDGPPPDLLINNAALINRPAPLWEISADEFGEVVDVNIKGAVHLIRAFVPAMITAGRGVIANLSSGWGRSASPEVAPYCATKWAIEGLTRALAQELPDGLAAVAVNPGVIDTEMLRRCFGEGAAGHVRPEAWVKKAAPFFLNLSAKDNGAAATVG